MVELVRACLGGPEYSTLWRVLRRRLEETWPTPVRSFVLSDLSEAERIALADLHGWRTVPTGSVKVRLEKLDQALRDSRFGLGAIEILEALSGPIVPQRPARAAAREARERAWGDASAHPAVVQRPQLETWLLALREHGLLARVTADLAGQQRVLAQALEVLGRLPTANKLLSVLAAEATGDPHALDPGAPLTSVVLRAVALLVGWPAVPGSAQARRRLWLEVGVLCDPLSADVLVFALRPERESPGATPLRVGR